MLRTRQEDAAIKAEGGLSYAPDLAEEVAEEEVDIEEVDIEEVDIEEVDYRGGRL